MLLRLGSLPFASENSFIEHPQLCTRRKACCGLPPPTGTPMTRTATNGTGLSLGAYVAVRLSRKLHDAVETVLVRGNYVGNRVRVRVAGHSGNQIRPVAAAKIVVPLDIIGISAG